MARKNEVERNKLTKKEKEILLKSYKDLKLALEKFISLDITNLDRIIKKSDILELIEITEALLEIIPHNKINSVRINLAIMDITEKLNKLADKLEVSIEGLYKLVGLTPEKSDFSELLSKLKMTFHFDLEYFLKTPISKLDFDEIIQKTYDEKE